MKIKTSELKDQALDWAVAKCEGEEVYVPNMLRVSCGADDGEFYHPSTDWAQGGPIIEREQITIVCVDNGCEWHATVGDYLLDEPYHIGPTPLIAAMRCLVASKLGDEVEVPEELI